MTRKTFSGRFLVRLDATRQCGQSRVVAGAAACVLLASQPVQAMEFDTGESGIKLRWDNTVKYSAAVRTRSRDDALVNGTTPFLDGLNQDDGDRNFRRGLISNRLDLLSEADLSYGNVGARLSAAGWYDTVYNRSNDNDSTGLFPPPGNSTSNSNRGVNEFTAGTRNLHGRKGEVLDAFVFGKFKVGDSSGSVRLGRHALVWGESLFLGGNAIAGAQGPTDLIKAVSVPNSQVKEIVMPVPQVSGQFSITPEVSVGAYYQFRYEPNRFPGAGSYFSAGDTGPNGGDFQYVGPFARTPVQIAKAKDSGQGGIQLKFIAFDTDFGLYALRFHNKGFQGVPTLGVVQTSPPNVVPPTSGVQPTSFTFNYHQGIRALGASFSHTFGDANVAGEASVRNNVDLASSRAADQTALVPPPVVLAPNNNSSNPAYAIGKTAHVNLSTIWTLPRTAIWQEANLLGEVAWNRMLSCAKNCATLDPNGTRDAWQMIVVVSPTYNQVLPGLNISVPFGLSYTPKSSRSLAVGPGVNGPAGGGSMNLGVQGLYLEAWRFGATYTHYYGPVNTFTYLTPSGQGPQNNFSWAQVLRDRDFFALSLSRTF